MRRWRLAVCLVLGLLAVGTAAAQLPPEARAGVLKVHASVDGTQAAFGSGVVVGAERVATNCHVLRGARQIEIEHGGRKWPARLQAGDADKDVCVLAVAGLHLPAVRIRSSAAVAVGETVAALGYSGGGALAAERGRIEALYDFRGGKVIQTSAAFDRGASGGGLFTESGELVGLLTFKVPSGGAFHFAVPADWIDIVARSGQADPLSAQACAFWEYEPVQRTPFLSAVWHEANRQWYSLYQHCLDWISAEPDNEQARRAMLRAVNELLARAD